MHGHPAVGRLAAALIVPRAPRNQRASPSPGWSAIGAMDGIEVVLISNSPFIEHLWLMEMRLYARPPDLSILNAQLMDHEIPTKRKYQLKKRADEMAETRRRITEAAVELHGDASGRPHDAERGRRAGRASSATPCTATSPPTPTCSRRARPTTPTANPWPDLEAWRAIDRPAAAAPAASTSSTPTTSAPSRCSATSCGTPSSSTPSRPVRRR